MSTVFCFNEAGAKSAGKRGSSHQRRMTGLVASMRPAQKAPENETMADHCIKMFQASMRPAQKAPENVSRTWTTLVDGSGLQ